MDDTINITIRVSRDCSGKLRFTKKEVKELVDSENILFVRNLVCRKHDGKVIGEIKNYTIS